MISNIANVNLLWTTRLIKRGVHFTYVNTYCTNHSPGRNQDTHDDNIVVLFPGQGSQFVGMGAEIADTSIGKNLYHRASQILGYDIGKLSSQGPKTKLDSTVYCQPAVIVASLAAYQIWRQQTPDVRRRISDILYSAVTNVQTLSIRIYRIDISLSSLKMECLFSKLIAKSVLF